MHLSDHRTKFTRAALAVSIVAFAVACSSGPDDTSADEAGGIAMGMNDTTHNVLTDAERAEGWELLFDGATTSGWRGFRQEGMPDGWQVVDGTLARVARGGDIVTERVFGDFELKLEWRVEARGNSGVFYRVDEGVETIYHSAPEYQILDDEGHADGGSELTSAGAIYGLYPAPRGAVKPAGEWNETRILVQGNHVQHWLNGVQTADYELYSDDWERRVRESKFNEWPPYGRAAGGNIGLQDHGDPVWYRNIKIRTP